MSSWATIDPTGERPVLAIGAARNEWDLCKQIPGCTIGKDGIWRANLAWPVYAAFRTIWQHQPIKVTDPLLQREADWMAEVNLRWHMRAALDAEDPELYETLLGMEIPGVTPQLSGVQRADVAWLMRWRRDILGHRRGNGKTPPLMRSMQLLHTTGELAPALVVCPDSAPLAWQETLAEWAPELRTAVIAGTATKRAKAIEKIMAGEADVGIIVWQNVRYHTRLAAYPSQAFVRCDKHGGEAGKTAAQCEVHEKDFNGLTWGQHGTNFRTVIPDEAHRMADATSKQTRALWWLMHHAENAWPTTGTLTPDNVGQLWPIQHGVDPIGFPVRSRWLDLVAIKDYAFAGRGEKILDIRPDNRKTYELVTLPMFRRIPHEIARAGQPGLAAPEFRYPVMSNKQETAYRQIAKAGRAYLDDSTLETDAPITAFTRLCQLASSMVEMVDGEDPWGMTVESVQLALPSHKVDDLIDFLADNTRLLDDDGNVIASGQWIIGVNSPRLVELAERKLDDPKIRITHTKIVGGMNHEAKHAAQQVFQSGEARVIFVNEAGRESIDLFAADGIYWMQPSPSFVHREQLTGRGDRWGQTREFRQVWALTPGTVDIRLYDLGLDKEERHQSMTGDANMLRWLMSVEPGQINHHGDGNDTGTNRPLAV